MCTPALLENVDATYELDVVVSLQGRRKSEDPEAVHPSQLEGLAVCNSTVPAALQPARVSLRSSFGRDDGKPAKKKEMAELLTRALQTVLNQLCIPEWGCELFSSKLAATTAGLRRSLATIAYS